MLNRMDCWQEEIEGENWRTTGVMMSIKEIMEVNAVAITATSTIAEVDLTLP